MTAPHPTKAVATILDEFMARYVEKEAKLRQRDLIRRAFDALVKPARKIGIYELRRSDVARIPGQIRRTTQLVMGPNRDARLSSKGV